MSKNIRQILRSVIGDTTHQNTLGQELSHTTSKPRWSTRKTMLLMAPVAGCLVFVALTAKPGPVPLLPCLPADTEASARQYLVLEGHSRRGKRFEELALKLGAQRRPIPSCNDALTVLGPPDLVAEDGKGYRILAYFYDRFGNRDWVVHIIDAPGRPLEMGYGAASSNNYSQWKPYGK